MCMHIRNYAKGTKARIVIHELLEAQNEQVGIKNSGERAAFTGRPPQLCKFYLQK